MRYRRTAWIVVDLVRQPLDTAESEVLRELHCERESATTTIMICTGCHRPLVPGEFPTGADV